MPAQPEPLDLYEPFAAKVIARKADEIDLMLRKHRDYGPTNIVTAPGGPVNGLAVRLHDKIARLANLDASGGTPEYESLIDTATDIANYGTILGLVLAGDWPGTEIPTDPEPVQEEACQDDCCDPNGDPFERMYARPTNRNVWF